MSSTPPVILVVDDEPAMLSLMSLVLIDAGYRIETARNGREALDAVGRCMPDLILLDMLMPEMDGWQFATAFHARHGPAVPIVIATAAEDIRQRAREVGAAGWVPKPFDIGSLLAAVESGLDGPPKAGAPPPGG